MQTDRDGGYHTATSDDNKGHSSLEEDGISIEDLNNDFNEQMVSQSPEVSVQPHEMSSMTDERRLLVQAAETFKGRAPIPPITDTPLSMDTTQKTYTDGERRKLKNTFQTYSGR